ncbi:unnamed protein product [Blepharisma stoltei]|uniref:Secreted protein n=1 Tax=Blepharisma stoltei TaxID=1481888 RepID=A0AAU9JR95_9CILI|nr:unnamed protein product [Blepharisma stoltei]
MFANFCNSEYKNLNFIIFLVYLCTSKMVRIHALRTCVEFCSQEGNGVYQSGICAWKKILALRGHWCFSQMHIE